MSYLAIARKYRPATFADIVGQEHVVRTLENALASDRIHHAYLFTGARGVGKTTAARAFAKALNCEKGPTASPCGVCTSCVEITNGNSPDLVEIDGASNNSVDDVRDLRETVNYAPTHGKKKVYLVDEVHMLSKAAFNALLKTLEEPPPHVVFIFATTEPNRILDTILSRVQRYDFRRIGIEPVAQRLREISTSEGATVSDHALRAIARAGDGSMRDAQSLLDKVISFGGAGGKPITDAEVAETLGLVDRGLLFTFVEGLVEGAPEKCLEAIAAVYDYGYELSEFTGELLELVRNATFVRLSPGAKKHVDLSADEIARLEAVVADVSPESLTRTFNALLDVHDQVSRAARPRIVLEMAVARLASVRPVEPVSGLLARLEQLERKLRSGGGAPPAAGQRSAARRPAPKEAIAPKESAPAKEAAPRKPPAAEARDVTPAPLPEPPRVTAPAPAVEAAPAPKPAKPAPKPAAPKPPKAPPAPPPMNAELASRWKQLVAHLAKLPAPAPRLAEGTPEIVGNVLRISIPSGRALAEARRAKGMADVQGELRALFPGVDSVEVVPLAGTATPAEQQKLLQQEVLDDPECKRIIQKLGAELEGVTSLRDEP